MDEPELLTRARNGDRDALDRLLRLHYDRLFALARRMTGNTTDALDATQDALIAIVRGLPRFDGRSAFTTWSYRVTMNVCLDELRRRRRRPTPVDEVVVTAAVAPTAVSVTDSVVDRITIDDALAELSEEFRAAVVLRDVIGLDYADIAEVLDIPPGTVRSRIARGRAQLAAVLGNPSGPDERQKQEQ